MYPILLALPFFQLKSLTVTALLALLIACFIFWRKTREEHYNLFETFDVFLLSLLVAFVVGRLIFVSLNWQQFVGQWWLIFDLTKKPGIDLFLALMISALYCYSKAKKHKWDAFEILDFWATAVSAALICIYIGFFLDGSYGGRFTKLPWGVIMPNNFEKTHPVQLYFAIFYLFLHIYLCRIEYQYRTFEWYRKGKKTAQSGFLFSSALIFLGGFYLLMTPFSLPSLVIFGLNLTPLLHLAILIFGLILLAYRSGRFNLPAKKRPISYDKQI